MPTPSIAPLPGPHGLYTVSVMPRFLLDSSRVGWRGAYFTDILGAQAGKVDHAHRLYCVQRNLHSERRQPLGARHWQEFTTGFSLWHPGEEQRFHWQGGGRSQYLFIAQEMVETVLGETRPPGGMGHEAPLRSRMLELLFDALQADLAQGSPAGPLVGESLIAGLLAHLSGPQTPANAKLSTRARHRALEMIDARFAEAITLQDLADAAGVGVRQLSRAFRESTGKTPHQLLLQRRAEHAKTLIAQGLPLVEVALQCGFSDQSQLTRTFTRQVGTTPGRFRAQLATQRR